MLWSTRSLPPLCVIAAPAVEDGADEASEACARGHRLAKVPELNVDIGSGLLGGFGFLVERRRWRGLLADDYAGPYVGAGSGAATTPLQTRKSRHSWSSWRSSMWWRAPASLCHQQDQEAAAVAASSSRAKVLNGERRGSRYYLIISFSR